MSDIDDLATTLAKTLAHVFVSPNVNDSNGEAANLVDVVDHLARAVFKLERSVERHGALLAAATVVGTTTAEGESPADVVMIMARELLAFAEVTR